MSAGVEMLCWGGPEHGRVLVADRSYHRVVFAIPRRVTASFAEASLGPALQTVTYDVERFRFGCDEWKVLVYPENKERHQARLTDVARGLARLCTWEWAL